MNFTSDYHFGNIMGDLDGCILKILKNDSDLEQAKATMKQYMRMLIKKKSSSAKKPEVLPNPRSAWGKKIKEKIAALHA